MTLSIEQFEGAFDKLACMPGINWRRSACGVTRAGREILALVDQDAFAKDSDRLRVVLVGGLSGAPEDVAIAMRASRFIADGLRRSRVAVTAVPCANPGGLALRTGPANGAGGRVDQRYPPVGGYFDHPTCPESRYLWRWVCFQGPDMVIEVRSGNETVWEVNAAAGALRKGLAARPVTPRDSFIAALGGDSSVEPGAIPGARLTVSMDSLERELGRFFDLLASDPPGPSQANQVLRSRTARDPFEVGRDLARTNGRTLAPIIYTQGVAISGRLRLALLEAAPTDSVADVAALVEPVIADQGRAFYEAFETAPTAPTLAAAVWAEEMLAITKDARYGDILAGAMHCFKSRGRDEPPYPLDPNFIAEDHFFASAVIGRGAHINTDTNTAGYVSALTQFIVNAGIQEENGLFKHSRQGPVHWGRGNGFAAMGLAEYLTYIPANWRRDDGEIESKFRRHMEALKSLQCPSGMYLQVLDYPGSYQELTATCMIGYAMARGIRLGLLDEGFLRPVASAWRAACERIDTAGNVIDGCAGTGVMDGLQSYLDRPANSGYDDRTGGMALWFAAEIARLMSEGHG